MKLLYTSLFALLISLASFSASAQYNPIDSGIHSVTFAEDEDEDAPKPGEEPECD